jgi:hypothetical protein
LLHPKDIPFHFREGDRGDRSNSGMHAQKASPSTLGKGTEGIGQNKK